MDSSSESKSFFKHVFNFDDESKADILNIFQYSMLAIIPIVIINKTMQKYVPEADDKKNSLELSAEVLIQIIVMFLGLLLIHRIITFVPTYSAVKYPDFHVIYIILAILMITMSLQTKLGEKVSILVDRIIELWNGSNDNKNKSDRNNVKVTQPISGQGNVKRTPMNYTDGTAISSLPTFDLNHGNQNTIQPQVNYDSMYRQDTTSLVGAATPGGPGGMSEGMSDMMEPMAANSVLGGSSFGSW